jgi:23S rRNA (pseudouridine1915-N3)-methyltransferase
VHIGLIAVGERQPAWVDAAFDDYTGRLPRHWRFALQAVSVARRGRPGNEPSAIAAEERKTLALVKPGDQVVLLDVSGEQMDSAELSAKLESWLAASRDLRFIIGGPDGVSQTVRHRADFCWSLSRLTLPHGLARVVFAEQLYRAWTIADGHPYHRE